MVVVGAGHAGCEAALAAARLGCRTLMLTTNLDNVALMSCNPSIGGPAKGQLVREIDALGGRMGQVIDATFLQMRLLNTGKGPAVQALRAQADKRAYQAAMRRVVESQPGLDFKQGMVEQVCVEDGRVVGVTTRGGLTYAARAVVLTTGTYLEGVVITGEQRQQSGPSGQLPAVGLSACLQALGLQMGRFKTGTPMRVDGKTANTAVMQRQDGDETPWRFSYLSEPEPRLQLPCWLTFTNPSTHAIIQANLHRAPLYTGMIEGRGPRYCPSIEDKVVRFADKDRHQVFLEPEGRDTCEMYVQGLSTSLPEDVQIAMLRTVPGLQEAEMMRAGYAIEYDYLVPTQLQRTLAVRGLAGLFAAGQINGTSGYEEAAAQGLIAGANAALFVQGRPGVTVDRAQGYIGVLIDDLVTKGTPEPYRMLTARAEYRLLLRHGNADLRLTELGRQVGLVDDERWRHFSARRAAVAAELQRLESVAAPVETCTEQWLSARGGGALRPGTRAAALLRRPQVSYADLVALGCGDANLSSDVIDEVVVQIKYAGYVAKEEAQVQRMRRLEEKALPSDVDYAALSGLSSEAREKLAAVRPETLGQASRVSGVTPADIAVLLVWLERGRRAAQGAS